MPFVNGREDWDPCQQHVAYGDPVAGLYAATGALIGLYARTSLGAADKRTVDQYTDEIREMIIARASIRALKEQARKEGTRFLRDAALELVRAGHTTLQEVNRVTFVA